MGKRSYKTRIAGIPVTVVDDEEAEQATYVVCMRDADQPVSPFRDNEHGLCALCLAPIHYRPHAPKKPPHICSHCALKVARQSSEPD